MAKPKKTENISALDYLCRGLNSLVKKIETSSRGKISKRDLLIYSLIIIFILSVRFGEVIGAFTFVLAVATIWNIRITQGLLKQSEEASRQSKVSFESDVFTGIVFSVSQLEGQLRMSRTSNTLIKRRCVDLALGMLGAIKKNDVRTYRKVKEIMKEVWPKSQQTLPIACIQETLKKLDRQNNDKTKKLGE